MEMQIIGRLSGAVKTHFNHEIARLNVLQGPNGSGKSARREAIELAIEHKRSAGKVDALTPPDGAPVTVQLQLYGALYTFDARLDTQALPTVAPGHATHLADPNNGTRAITPVIVRPATALAELGSGRAREEIVARWGGDQTVSINPPASLSPEQRALWIRGLSEIRTQIEAANVKAEKKGHPPTPSDPAAFLSELQSWARREKLAQGRQRDALAAAIASASASPEAVAGAEDLARLEALLAQAETAERTAQTHADMRARIEYRLNALNASISAFNSSVQTFQALQAPPDRTPFVEAVDRTATEYAQWRNFAEAARIIRAAIEANATHCFVCQSQYDRAAALPRFTVDPDHVSKIKAVADQAAQTLATVDASRASYDAQRAALMQEQARIAAEQEALGRDATAVPSAYTGESSSSLRPRVASARAAEAARQALAKQGEQLEQAKRDWDTAKMVEVTAGIELSSYTARISGALISAIEQYLAPVHRGRFAFDLDACRFEMIGADGRPHGRFEQSGAEFTALTLALARAWASGSPYILLLEYGRDLAELDTYGALASVLEDLGMAAAGNSDCLMVLIASPTPLPVGDAWHVIHTARPETPAALATLTPTASLPPSPPPLGPPLGQFHTTFVPATVAEMPSPLAPAALLSTPPVLLALTSAAPPDPVPTLGLPPPVDAPRPTEASAPPEAPRQLAIPGTELAPLGLPPPQNGTANGTVNGLSPTRALLDVIAAEKEEEKKASMVATPRRRASPTTRGGARKRK